MKEKKIHSQTGKISLCTIAVVLLAAAIVSCNGKTNPSNGLTGSISNTTAKTQALLMTQPFAYDATDKNKITGKYENRKELTVPNDLATQSKWIMFEGPVLENDLVAYRYYADSRHRFDTYGKLVSDLVMDSVSWKYHDIMDWGSDILKVGNSLGMGSPAIYYKDSLYTLSVCEQKDIAIRESGKNISMIRTTWKGLTVAEHQFDLIQDWSLAAGEPWSEIKLTVVNGSLPDGMQFATGFVKHLPEVIQGTSNDIFFAMNWGQQSFHKEDLGMAIMADAKYQPKQIMDDMSHAYYFENANKEVTYQFLSVWERDKNNVKDRQAFKRLVEKATLSLK